MKFQMIIGILILNGNGTTQPVKKIYEQKLNQTFQ